MLSLLKNKIRNKFLQTDYIHPYIIWCIDVFYLSYPHFLSFYFSTILINISIHFNQQRYIPADSGHFQYRMDWNL